MLRVRGPLLLCYASLRPPKRKPKGEDKTTKQKSGQTQWRETWSKCCRPVDPPRVALETEVKQGEQVCDISRITEGTTPQKPSKFVYCVSVRYRGHEGVKGKSKEAKKERKKMSHVIAGEGKIASQQEKRNDGMHKEKGKSGNTEVLSVDDFCVNEIPEIAQAAERK